MDRQQQALVSLGRRLAAEGYRFTTVTPQTHRRVVARGTPAGSSRATAVFGWNAPFAAGDVGAQTLAELDAARALEVEAGGQFRSRVRFSTVGPLLVCHSPFPTTDHDSVFFGPDTYRFIRAIDASLAEDPAFAPQAIVEIGAGTGAAGLHCARRFRDAHVMLTDVNETSLRYAEVNAAINACANVEFVRTDLLSGIERADLIVFNAPYLVDPMKRAYRDGGGAWGCEVALRFLREAIPKIGRDGKLLLYTGAPVVAGEDKFLASAVPLLDGRLSAYRYEEIDPDVFGEELEQPPYTAADRIAVVCVLVAGADVRR
jgi:methylase of polypeptide subunit release factors